MVNGPSHTARSGSAVHLNAVVPHYPVVPDNYRASAANNKRVSSTENRCSAVVPGLSRYYRLEQENAPFLP